MANSISTRLTIKPQIFKKNKHVSAPRMTLVHVKKSVTTKKITNARKTPPTAGAPAVKSADVKNTDVKSVNIQDRQRVPGGQQGRAVSLRPRSLKKRSPAKKGVKYITQDVSGFELEKLRNVRGRGRGRILVIVGNGPSVNEMALDMLTGHPAIDIMSINRPDRRIWPTAYWAFFDLSQLRRNADLWDNYGGVVFNSTSIKQRRPNSIQVKNLGGMGFSHDLMKGLHIGRSSVYAAMQIALWLDFAHVYIVGIDMTDVGGQLHFYGNNPDVAPDKRLERFDREAEYYADAAETMPEHERMKFTFCSSYNKYSFISKFNVLDHRDAVAVILQKGKEVTNG